MEVPIQPPSEAESTTTSAVTVVAAEDIDTTFKSDSIGTPPPYPSISSTRAHPNILH